MKVNRFIFAIVTGYALALGVGFYLGMASAMKEAQYEVKMDTQKLEGEIDAWRLRAAQWEDKVAEERRKTADQIYDMAMVKTELSEVKEAYDAIVEDNRQKRAMENLLLKLRAKDRKSRQTPSDQSKKDDIFDIVGDEIWLKEALAKEVETIRRGRR